MNMILKYIDQYFRDIYVLFNSKILKKKFFFFCFYNYLCIKNIIGKITKTKFQSQNFLGFKSFFGDFSSFFSTFTEIFIYNIYYFETNEDKPIIIDCGANIGLSVLYFKYMYPNAKIECYEPDLYSFKTLQKNITINHLSNITAINKAVGNINGKTTFYTGKDIEGCTGNSTEKNHIHFKEVESYEVEITKLSNKGYNRIDYLKIDIEGGEGKVFNELDQNGIFKKIHSIGLEYHYENGNQENKLSEILGILEKNKYHTIININTLITTYCSRDLYRKNNNRYVLMVDAYK